MKGAACRSACCAFLYSCWLNFVPVRCVRLPSHSLSFKCRPPFDVLHQFVKLRGGQRLRAVTQRVFGVVVHLDHQARPPPPPGQPSASGSTIQAMPAAWLGIHHHRQMGIAASAAARRKCPACCAPWFQRSRMPRSQRITRSLPAGHDVFRAHQQLLDGVGQPPLEQDGLVAAAPAP